MKTYYILKNENNKYFYSLKNFLDSPEFGDFDMSQITMFDDISLAETSRVNLEAICNHSIFIEKIEINISLVS